MQFVLKNSLLFLLIICTGWVSTGCKNTDVECPGDSIGQLKIGFVRKNDTTTTHFTVYCPAIPNDTSNIKVTDTLYNNKVAPVKVEIPVDITSDSMAIYIDFTILKTDSTPYKYETDVIALKYDRNSYINDLECGVITEFSIKKVYYSNNHPEVIRYR